MEDRTIADWMGASDSNEQKVIINDIAGRIDLGLLTVPGLFHDLQPYLASEDRPLPEIAQALSLLSLVLETLQIPINRADVHELTVYFCARLDNKDNVNSFRAGVAECARILYSLSIMENKRFSPSDAKLVAQSVFAFNKAGNLKDQKASTRLSLLELMLTMMRLYKPSLITNVGSKAFVEGLVAMAEFEKDPTCLNVLFPIYEIFGREWDLEEDALVSIWASFIRYYPIKISGRATSVPSPDQLKQLLLDCFISNDVYAKFAFPRLVELLDTEQDLSANVKMDVLFTMAYAVSGYSPSEVLSWATPIWDSLKFEIWNGDNSDTIASSLTVITNIAKSLSIPSIDWSDTEHPHAKALLAILAECNRHVADTRPENMAKTGSILHAIAEATPYAFSWVARRFLPIMFTLWQTLNSEDAKSVLLTILNTILEARVALGEELNNISAKQVSIPPLDLGFSSNVGQTKLLLDSSLVPFQRNLIDEVYFSAMTDNISNSADGIEYRGATIRGLEVLMRIPNMLSEIEKGMIIESLNSVLLQPNEMESIKKEAVSGLQKMSSTDPANFQRITLSNFMAKLPQKISGNEADQKSELESVIYIFDALVQIACTAVCNFDEEDELGKDLRSRDRVFTAFQKAMVLKLINVLEHDGQVRYMNVILGAVYHGLVSYDAVLDLTSKSPATLALSIRNASYHPYAWIVSDIYEKVVVFKNVGEKDPYIGFKFSLQQDEQTVNKFVSLVGNITTLALRSRQTTTKNNFLNAADENDHQRPSQVWSLFTRDSPESINSTQPDLLNSPADKFLANALSMSLVAGVSREEKSRLQMDVGKVALTMVINAISPKIECSQYGRITMLHFTQLLVNKFGASSQNTGDLTLAQFMTSRIQDCANSGSELEIERCYQALAYFTAAALARSDPCCHDLLSLMVDGLKHPKVGRKVAQSFRILLAPSNIMSEANFCLIRPLRQGRLFSSGVENIKALWHEFSFAAQNHPLANDIKTNCLIAFASSLAYMDTKVYLTQVGTVLPLLLEGTNVQNDDFTKLSCINIIRKLVPLCPAVVKVHLDSVINRMTDRTHNTYYSPSDASAGCRVAAVEVLALLPRHVDNAELLKRKTKIMAELDTALNDVSMEVRLRAQKCKMAYFNLEG